MVMVELFKRSCVVKALYRGMWKAAWLFVTGYRYRMFLNSPNFKGLHVGCGHNVLPGWFNTDLFTSKVVTHMDIKKPLNLPNNCLDALYAEHVIEHMTREEFTQFLREANRTLRAGGILRLVTPDLGFFLNMVVGPANPSTDIYLNWFSGGGVCREIAAEAALNAIIGDHGHRHVYTEGSLTAFLRNAGFTSIKRFQVGESNQQFLRGIEGHGKLPGIGDEINRLESLVLESILPDCPAGN